LKKLIVLFLFGLFAVIGLSMTSYADDELVELYPYDQQACLDASASCTQTKVGDSHWSFVYYGHRYHVVRGSARYVTEFNDTNADGFISALEMTSTPWNAFASVIINDTDESVVLSTANARTDLTSVVHRKYAYFDETGQLQMFEDHISTFYIHNDGTDLTPANADWRLATVAEKDAYIAAANPAVDTPNTRLTYMRMALSDTDSDGYVIEPIGYLKWTNADVDTVADTDVTHWSTIIAGNPNYVGIPAGWTVVSFGTNDRGTLNTKTTNYILSLPTAMLDDTVAPFELEYVDQPSTFAGITALDDDLVTPGTNIVVDYNGAFDLPTTVTASWLDMFNDAGKIINATEMLDYSVVISQDGVDLQTINYTYDDVGMVYTASGPVTAIDSSDFGSGYTATWMVTNPAGLETSVSADIVIGVMPPKFMGVADRYVDQSVYVDLLADVNADDGYGNDKTSSIVVTTPAGFNMYNPLPGTYQIDLTFTHHVHFDGVQSNVNIEGTVVNFNETTALNANVDISTFGSMVIFTDIANFTDSVTAYGSVIAVIAANNTVKEVYDRYDWGHITSTGEVIEDGTLFAAWQAALTLAPGEFIVAGHGSTVAAPLRALLFGDPVTLTVGYPNFDYDIVTDASYMLTVDDLTAPLLLVVDHHYTIASDEFTTVNNAILSNVVAFDYTDDYSDLAIYVSNAGGMSLTTPGTYTVEVTVEDVAGNTAIVSFPITVVATKTTVADVQALIDAQTLTAAEIQALIDALGAVSAADVQALIDAQTLTAAEIQALIDASQPADTGCGSALSTGSVIFFVLSATAIASTIFIARNKKETSK